MFLVRLASVVRTPEETDAFERGLVGDLRGATGRYPTDTALLWSGVAGNFVYEERNFDIANFPAGPKTNAPFYVTSWGISIANQSKKKDLAKTFLDWATSKELAAKAMAANITMARSSVWDDKAVVSKIEPGLVETRAFAAKNGTPSRKLPMAKHCSPWSCSNWRFSFT